MCFYNSSVLAAQPALPPLRCILLLGKPQPPSQASSKRGRRSATPPGREVRLARVYTVSINCAPSLSWRATHTVMFPPLKQCEQMEVELHDVGATARTALKGRLDNYRKELTRLRKEFVSRLLIEYCVAKCIYTCNTFWGEGFFCY